MDKEADIQMFTIPEEALTSIKEGYSTTTGVISALLFLDLNMPSMTGWEFLNVFMLYHESINEHFTIYILSSSIEDFTERIASYTFIQGFLSKPLKIENLEKVRKELQQ